MKGTLLFADDQIEFLNARKELLEKEGYKVLTATSPEEAKEILERGGIDLAILDIRLKDNNDSKDFSGLLLAKEFGANIPKIMLTQYPSVEVVREALSPNLRGFAAAVDFVVKKEGPEALLVAIQNVLRRNVFVAFGHDFSTCEAVELHLKNLGLRPIILLNKIDVGDIVFDTLEKRANVAFAVVILTADDIGGTQNSKKHNPRARQNVIFELGYFLGKLGRHKVAVLSKDAVEIPSNYGGVLYIPMKQGDGWKQALTKAMKKAGLDVDISRAI